MSYEVGDQVELEYLCGRKTVLIVTEENILRVDKILRRRRFFHRVKCKECYEAEEIV